MKFKKIMLVTFLLLAILTMGAASASEDVASDDSGLAVVDGGASVDAPAEEVETDDVLSYDYDDFDPEIVEEAYLDEVEDVISITPPVAGNLSVSVNDGVETSEHLYEITEEDVEDEDFGLTLSDLEIAQEGTYFISAKFISPSGDETTIFENAQLKVYSEENLDEEYEIYLDEGTYSLSDDEYDIVEIDVPEDADGYVVISIDGYDDHEIPLSDLKGGGGCYYIYPNTLSWVAPGTYQIEFEYCELSDILATASGNFTFYNDEEDDEDDAGDGVVIRVAEDDEFDLNDEEDLNAPFAFVSVQNDLSGRIVFIVWSIGEGEEQELFSFDLENITNTEEDPDNEGFTIYKLSLNDLGTYDDLISRSSFKLAFIDDVDAEIDSRNYDIDYDDEENIVTFSESKVDADDGVVIRVAEDDEFDLTNEDDLNAPFAFVSVNNGLSGRIVIMVWSDEEGEEQQQFGIDLENITNTEDDPDNEGFTIYKLSLNDLGNYDDFIECGSFRLAFIGDMEGEIDSRKYDIDYDDEEGIVTFCESDEDEDEEIHGEGEKIEAEFSNANVLDNGVVVTIPKDELSDDVDNEFTVIIPQEDDEPIEITLKLDEILEGDNYVIRVSDLELPEFREGYDILMILQFYADGEEAYYAEWMDDEEPIHIYESPCIFNESSLLGDDDVITIQEIPEGVDEFTVTISKDGMDDIVKTFKFSELVEDEEEVWVSLKLADLGITETGEYEITVKYSDDLTYSGNLNVTNDVDIRTHELDDEGDLETFESVDELVANFRISESVTGYVKIYVNDTQVGGNINLADLPMGAVPPDDGRQIVLNDLKITESGRYKVKLELYSDADELLGDAEFDILVEVGENSVYVNEDAYPYGTEANDEVIGYTIGAPLSDGQYFNIYFNGTKAGVITSSGLEFNDEFTVPMFDVLLFKPGNYDVNVTFFDGENETDVTTGSFSINELALTSDKAVYIFEEDHVMISFNADSLDDDDRVEAYYVYEWGPVGREDERIFNPYDGKDLKDEGLYDDGVVSFDAAWTPDDRYKMDEGTTLIYVVYGHGDVRYGGFINVTIVEAPEPVDPELAIDPVDDVEEGTNVVISISALDNFTGSVKVFVGDSEVGAADIAAGSGTFTIGAGNFTVGENTVKVVSDANENFTAGSANVTFNVIEKVVPPTPEPVDPNLTISVDDIREGTDAVITITTNSTFSGNVKVQIGTNNYAVPVTNGTGSYSVPGLAVGNYTAVATFEATEEFIASTKNATFKVNKAVVPDPETAISTDSTSSNPNPVYSINLGPDATGNFTVKVGDKEYTKELKGGAATIEVTDLPAGTYEAVISYSGDAKYAPISKTVNATVKAVTVIKATDVTTTYGTSKNIVITLTDANGNALAGKKVTVVLNGAKKELTTDAKGQASYAVGANLAVKTYEVSFTFDGDANYTSSTGTAKVVVNKAKSKLTAKKKTFKAKKKSKKYTVTLKTDKGKALKKVKVTLTGKFKGKKIKITKKTNSKGKATFNLKKLTKKGKFKATVKFAGNKNYKASSKKVKITIK